MSQPTRRCLVSLSLSCIAAIACGESTAYGQFGRQSVLPTARELNRLGLEQSWWSQATINSNLDELVYLTSDEDAVFAQSRTGIVTAF